MTERFDFFPDRWFPTAEQYGESIARTTNTPYAFMYGTFLAVSGHILGRRTFLRYGTRLYPNHYICLVGPSGVARKSTAMNLALEAVEQYVAPPLKSLSTSQGLLQHMSEVGGPTMIVLDEVAAVMQQKRRDYAADMIARLTELYSCPNVAVVPTKHDPLRVPEPFLTFISGSTSEWLRDSFTTYDLLGGFGNRMTFIMGDARPDVSQPIPPTFSSLDWARLERFNGEILWDESTVDIWQDYYARYAARQEVASPFIRVLGERFPEKVLKAATVITAWENGNTLQPSALEYAIDWGEYLYECLIRLAPVFEEMESQILELLRHGAVTRQVLFKQFPGYSTKRLREAVANLLWARLIVTDGDVVSTVE